MNRSCLPSGMVRLPSAPSCLPIANVRLPIATFLSPDPIVSARGRVLPVSRSRSSLGSRPRPSSPLERASSRLSSASLSVSRSGSSASRERALPASFRAGSSRPSSSASFRVSRSRSRQPPVSALLSCLSRAGIVPALLERVLSVSRSRDGQAPGQRPSCLLSGIVPALEGVLSVLFDSRWSGSRARSFPPPRAGSSRLSRASFLRSSRSRWSGLSGAPFLPPERDRPGSRGRPFGLSIAMVGLPGAPFPPLAERGRPGSRGRPFGLSIAIVWLPGASFLPLERGRPGSRGRPFGLSIAIVWLPGASFLPLERGRPGSRGRRRVARSRSRGSRAHALHRDGACGAMRTRARDEHRGGEALDERARVLG